MNDLDTIRKILAATRTIAVVGASDNPARDSNHVTAYLIGAGFDVYPVNPNAARVHGRACVASLAELAHSGTSRIDTVVCFRRSEEIVAIAESAVGIGAAHLWMQMGVINEAAKAYAEEAAMLVVMDRCIMVEHRRLAAS